MYSLNLEYFAFLLIASIAFFRCGKRYRPLVLLLTSLGIAAWYSFAQLLWLVPVVAFNDLLARRLEVEKKRGSPASEKLLLRIGVILNLTAIVALRVLDSKSLIPAPIGHSFVSLMMIGHIIDVYRGVVTHERNPVIFSLYGVFFGTSVSGPIERSRDLIPQFKGLKEFNAPRARSGLILIYVGLIKKLVLANGIGAVVKVALLTAADNSGPILFLVSVLARTQLMFDLAAFTDISRGSARVLGIRLSRNFERPYAATSFADFWRQWHMTLSTWFRDYVFYPMVGSPLARLGVNVCVIMSFCLIGAWHSFKVNLLVFGALHGALMVLDQHVSPALRKLPKALGRAAGWLWTWGICASLPMVLFYTQTLSQASFIYRKMIVDTFLHPKIEVCAELAYSFKGSVPIIGTSAILLATAALSAFGPGFGGSLSRLRRRFGTHMPVLYFCGLWILVLFSNNWVKSFAYQRMR